MKMKNLILFLALLTLLVGVVSATDVSDDTGSVYDSNEQIMQDTQSKIVNDNNNVNDNLQKENNINNQIKDNTIKTIEENTSDEDISTEVTEVSTTADENITSEVDDTSDISENEQTEDIIENTTITNPTIAANDKNIKQADNDDTISDDSLIQQIKDSLLNVDVDSLINSLNNTINDIANNLNISGKINSLDDTINERIQNLNTSELIDLLNKTINNLTENVNSGSWLNSLNDTLNNLSEKVNKDDLINNLYSSYNDLVDKLNSGEYIENLNEDIKNLKEKINSGDYEGIINDTVNNLNAKLNASKLISSLNDTLNNIEDNIKSESYIKSLNDTINNLTRSLNTSGLIESLNNTVNNLTDNLNVSDLIDSLNNTFNNISQKVNTTEWLNSLNKTLNELKQRINSSDIFDSADNAIKNITNIIDSIKDKINHTQELINNHDIIGLIQEYTDINNQINTLKDLINQLLHPNTTAKVTAIPTSGILGEKLVLNATVTDGNNKKINEGNMIFKINGITVKDNGKLTGSSNPLKVKVVNGVATAIINLDLDMKSASKYVASYMGTKIYNSSVSDEAKIQVSKRNASIEVSSNKKTIKQGQVLTLTAKVYDTTNGKKSTNLTKYDDEFVFFKVNGITLKDSKGQMLKVKVKNGVATVNYTIPLGLSGVTDGKSMTIKNHTILAQFCNKYYQEDIRNTSTFQVEKSNITITINDATITKKTHKLSLKATIKDYLGNIVKGPNKCVIKINGITLKNGTEPMYYYSTDGILNVQNIDIPSLNKYTNIEVVTQDRLAYKNQRNTTTNIKVVN